MNPLLTNAIRAALARRSARAVFASFFVVAHIVMFVLGAHAQNLPFNRAPNEPPHFVDIHADALGPFPREPVNWTRLVVSRFDSQHYESFALRGFGGCPEGKVTSKTVHQFMRCNIAWLPGYGILGGVFVRILPFGADYVLMGISMVSLWILIWLWTSPVLVRRFGAVETIGSVVALNVFPSAFHFVTPYAESITVVCAFAAFYALARGRWLTAALLVGASTAFRPTAVVFSAAFGAAAALRSYRAWRDEKPDWRPLASVPLSAWGLTVTVAYYTYRFGDPLLFNHARALFGDRPDVARLFTVSLYIEGFATREYDLVVLAGMAILVALGAARALRRCPIEERVYLALGTGLSTAMALVNATDRWGLNRYMLLAVLVFLAAGSVLRRAPLVYALWLVFCGALYWHVALCNYVSHGNTRMCPLVGPNDGMELPIDG